MKIAQLTSVHPRHDIRIFVKQCSSLAKAGFSVHFIVADGKGNEEALKLKTIYNWEQQEKVLLRIYGELF